MKQTYQLVVGFAYWFLISTLSWAQSSHLMNAVKWKNSIQPTGVYKKGDQITLIMEAKIDKCCHVYSSVPPPKESIMPTELILDKIKGVQKVG
ncbi:MAG: hypothetical protein NZ108_06515, partial [Bacteroidia bacterium]|nr:hypothetical protein [Bacteroidia bacterium]